MLSNEKIINYERDSQKLNIAIVGRLNKSKRPYDVLSLAQKTVEIAHYHFFGDGSLYNELVLEIEKRNIINITLHGMVSNPFKYIKDMGVYLSCSESEGFPNALIESMLCNAIPLHSDCKTGPKEILCDSYTDYTSYPSIFSIEKRGILFPVGDVNALEKAIVYISENYEDLKKGFTGESVDFLSTLNSELISEKYYRALMQGNK
jgi:N-acetylgalactosamine-N,N'-diacetylbacillosaminyl-diphospho-undecaprenol 4-alpha-N-acetylgalactosaminyltransferase